MSSRQAFLNCIQAKANAQLDTAKDRISDPTKAEELRYLKQMTSTKLSTYRQALSEILDDELSTPELRAHAKQAVDGMIDTFELKAAGKARSFMMGQKGANFIREVAKRSWGPEENASGLFWSAPHLRTSDIAPSAQVLSLEDIYRSTRSQHYGRLDAAVSIMNDEAKIFFHTQNKEMADAVYRDMFDAVNGKPRATNKAVKSASDALIEYDKDMVTELRARGVPIPEGGRKNYVAGKVQHNSMRMAAANEADYVRDMVDLYNSGGINKELIDKAISGPITPAKLEIAFKSIFRSETGQELDVVPKALGTRVAQLHKTKEMHRILEFTDFDSMKKFDSKYGFDNNYEKFTSLVERNVRTLATLDAFGTDRAAAAQQMRASLVRAYGEKGGAAFDRNYMNALKHYGSGFRNPLDPNLSSNIAGVKSFAASSLLGKHPVGALTTDWSINLPRTFSVIGRSYLTPFYEGMKNIASRLTGTYAERKAILRTLGGEVDSMVADIQGSIHTTNATGMSKLGGAAYKMVEVGSGNRLATKITRRLAGTTFANTLSEHIDTGGKFGDTSTLAGALLHSGPKKATFSKFLEGFGVSRDDVLKMKPYLNSKGGMKFVDASMIPVGDNELRRIYTKLIAAQAAVIEQSSPTASAKFSATLGAMKEGGPGRAAAIEIHSQFLAYVSSMLQNNILPLLKSQGSTFSKVKAGAAYTSMLLTAGIMTEWIYDLIKGRDPQPISPTLIAKGFMRAGIGGPAMDFVGSVFLPNQKGGLVDSPILDKASDIAKAAKGVATGEKGAASKAIKVAGDMMPGSALWWLETIYKQGLIHHLREMADPAGTRKADARRKANAKSAGTDYWVKPGLEVDRGPNLENIKPKG